MQPKRDIILKNCLSCIVIIIPRQQYLHPKFMHTSYNRLDALYRSRVWEVHSGEFAVCTTIDQGDGDRGGSFEEIELR